MQPFSAFLYGLLVCVFLSGPLTSLGIAQSVSTKSGETAAPVSLITQPIDEGNLVTLHGTVHPLATPSADQGPAPDSLATGRTILMLKRSAAQESALEKLVADQQNPNSSSYHKWLTPASFGQQFGASAQDIQKVTQWLESHGFQVDKPMPGGNLIMFSGTHEQLKSAFHTELHSYKINGVSYWANATDPQIPAALAPAISGFSSLNNFPKHAQHTTPQLIRRDHAAWKSSSSGPLQAQFTTTQQGSTVYAIGPADLGTIYNMQPLWNAGIDGTGETIAIVSDSDINPADVDYFRSTFGLSAKKLNLLYFGPNPGPTQDESEADLDVEWAGAVAQNATIDLVVAANSATSGGIDGAAAYIINNNLASILNVSYGACESALGAAGNLFYSEMWQQAAAQGISVFVAAGDDGSAGCDDNAQYATKGLAVSGLASTPYNVAVGGTDLYGSFTSPSTYWNAANDSTTLASAKSYIPELPWDNSCASPEILAALQAEGLTDTTPEQACNDSRVQAALLTTAGGSGGASSCATTSSGTTCAAGYPKPNWQSGVAGIPSDNVRDLPDVSLMAGNGLWGSFYVYCQSDATPNATCDVNTALEGAGGTSFASPIFAGIMALIQQKTGSEQGNVNYVLYKLAAMQYADSSNSATCSTGSATTGNACMFYDITAGTNAMPCIKGMPDCTPAVGSDLFGILPGYNSTAGYDLATGLGSVNASNLVNGWNSAASQFFSTTTALTASGSTTVAYGSNIDLNVSVAPVAPATGTPGGMIGITSNSPVVSSDSIGNATLNQGQAAIASASLIPGTYQIFAHYAGDASFAPSQSSGVTVTVTSGTVTTTLEVSRASVTAGQNVLLSLAVNGVPNGVNPTGTVTFTDVTTGTVLGATTLVAAPSSTVPASVGYVTVAASKLQLGSNTITASYSGDTAYGAATSGATVVTAGAAFTTSINPASLTLSANSSGSVVVTATPSTGTLDAAAITFSCPATLPSGLTCSFSVPTAGGGGAVNSTLTVGLASPLYMKPVNVATSRPARGGWLDRGAAAGLACVLLFGFPRRRRKFLSALMILVCGVLTLTTGCGGNSAKSSLIPTTTTLTSSGAATLDSPVTLTAHVAATSGTGSPTGTVTFSAAGKTLNTGTVASGTASFSTSSLPVGTTSVTATYSGDTSYAASTSTATSLDVTFSTSIAVTAADSAGDSSTANLAISVQ